MPRTMCSLPLLQGLLGPRWRWRRRMHKHTRENPSCPSSRFGIQQGSRSGRWRQRWWLLQGQRLACKRTMASGTAVQPSQLVPWPHSTWQSCSRHCGLQQSGRMLLFKSKRIKLVTITVRTSRGVYISKYWKLFGPKNCTCCYIAGCTWAHDVHQPYSHHLFVSIYLVVLQGSKCSTNCNSFLVWWNKIEHRISSGTVIFRSNIWNNIFHARNQDGSSS